MTMFTCYKEIRGNTTILIIQQHLPCRQKTRAFNQRKEHDIYVVTVTIHHLTDQHAVTNFTARKQILRRRRKCFTKCLKTGQLVLDCKSGNPCYSCGNNHYITTYEFRNKPDAGFFERSMCCVKRHLKKTLGNARLLIEELQTDLREMEWILNSHSFRN